MKKTKKKVAKAKKVVKVVELKAPSYSIEFAFGTTKTEGSGETIYDALVATPRPTKITTKGVLTVTNGARKFVHMYSPLECKKFFYPIAQRIMADRLGYLLK